MKLELLTNATVVDDAIRFVTSNANAGDIHNTHIHILRQGQGQREAVKPKTDASLLDSTGKEESDIQGPQEEAKYPPGNTTTTNSIF